LLIGIYFPDTVEKFEEYIVEHFLSRFPVRFFTANWVASLDDSTGHENLLYQMRDALERDSWRASGGGVFIPATQ
jgi:hypothetical protein